MAYEPNKRERSLEKAFKALLDKAREAQEASLDQIPEDQKVLKTGGKKLTDITTPSGEGADDEAPTDGDPVTD